MRTGKVASAAALGVFMAWAAISAGQEHAQQHILNLGAETAWDALPGCVAHLLDWPDQSVLTGPHRVYGTEVRRIRAARRTSVDWINKVVDEEWLPEEEGWLEQNLIMLRDSFGEFDATRVQWRSNGYTVQISQTSTIIAIRLTPDETRSYDAVADKRAWAARLCSRVINDRGVRHGLDARNQPVEVPVTGLRAKITGYCLEPDSVHSFADGSVAGVCALPSRDIPKPSRDAQGAIAEARSDNQNWDETRLSWGYWWRHMGWWSDGKSVGFFTLKTEGGSWHANYQDQLGARWFEGPAPLKPTSNPARNPPAAPTATP